MESKTDKSIANYNSLWYVRMQLSSQTIICSKSSSSLFLYFYVAAAQQDSIAGEAAFCS